MLAEIPSELREKLQIFKSDNIVQLPTAVERLPRNLLLDDLFVRMMVEFASEIELDINRVSEIRMALLHYVGDFRPDGIIMHMAMATFLYRGGDGAPFIYDARNSKIQCGLFGISTVVYQDYNEFPYHKVLMIRNGEPNPLSMLLSFNRV